MSNLGLNIGLQGLLSSQASLDTIGNNITNANTPGYSRQSLALGPAPAVRVRNLLIGSGVQASLVRRTVDQLLNTRLVTQQAGVSRLDARLSVLGETESLLGGVGENGLAKTMQSFFGALSDLSASPEDPGLRAGAVQSAVHVASRFGALAGGLEGLSADTAGRIRVHVAAANQLAEQIAGLNRQITSSEASGAPANDLRDRRELALRELAELVDVKTVENAQGAVRVLVNGHTLVSPTSHTRLELTLGAGGEPELSLQGKPGGLDVRGGAIGGLLQSYRELLPVVSAQVDALARNWILELNRVHSTGVAGDGPFATLTAANAFQDGDGDGAFTDELLAASGLPFELVDGRVLVNVTDRTSGAVEQHELAIDVSRTTVGDLLAAFNSIDRLSATIDDRGRLRVLADPGFGFDFAARLDSDPDPIGSFGGGRASLATAADGPFALAHGDTLQLTGASGSFTLTFDASDFANIGAATAEEIAAVINADPNAIANGLSASAVGGRLALQTAGSGASESFTVDGGTALGALGWSAATTVSGHDTAVSVTIGGRYTGASDARYVFVPNMDGVVGTTPGLEVLVYDGNGQQVAKLDVGAGYAPGDELQVLNGITLELGYGTLSASNHDVFQLRAIVDSDTSDLLPALGLNALFTGSDAASMAVREDLIDTPGLLAGSLGGGSGDAANLLALAAFDHAEVEGLAGVSFVSSWADLVSGVGLEIGAARDAHDSENFLMQSLEARRDEVSGVNVDEELVHMLSAEQAYTAAAQFIRVSGDLSDELMRLL